MNGQQYFINYFDTNINCIRRAFNILEENGVDNVEDRKIFYQFVLLAKIYASKAEKAGDNNAEVRDYFLWKLDYVDTLMQIHLEVCCFHNHE